jgi:phage shock protein C
MEKKLYRSRSDRMIGGVCGGLGAYLNTDPVWIRLLFVILLFATGFGFWAYLILWIIMPAEKDVGRAPGETVQANVQEMADRARELGEGLQRSLQRNHTATESGPSSGTIIVGLAFVALGGFLLLRQLGLFSWLNWGLLWPLALIFVGGALLFSRIRE